MSDQALPLTRLTTVAPMAVRTTPTLMNAAVSEAMRLARPTFLGSGAILVTALTLLVAIITYVGASGNVGDEGFGPMSPQLEGARGLVSTIETSANLLGIVVLSLAAVAVAGDYGSGMIRLLVQAEPRRWRLIVGKLAALAGITIGAAALATIIGVAASPILAPIFDISTAAWSDGAVETVATTFLNLALGLFVWTTLGFTIAVATHSTAAAVAGGIGYIMVFENLLGLVSQNVVSWLPGSTIQALVAGGNATQDYRTALALSVGYVLLGAVVSLVMFTRRDITA